MPFTSDELTQADQFLMKIAATFPGSSHEGLILAAARNIMAKRALDLLESHLEEMKADGPS